MRILATRSAMHIATQVCKHLQEELTDSGVTSFSDGEIAVDIKNTVRRKDVYIIASISTSDDLVELLLLINAAKGASAKSVNVVFAYYGYARQDRKDQHRGAIGARMVANCVEENGADHVTILDIHANQVQGFFKISSDLIYGYDFFSEKLQGRIEPDNTVIVAQT
jgi:ribose-phosphate pyrophosphokinase